MSRQLQRTKFAIAGFTTKLEKKAVYYVAMQVAAISITVYGMVDAYTTMGDTAFALKLFASLGRWIVLNSAVRLFIIGPLLCSPSLEDAKDLECGSSDLPSSKQTLKRRNLEIQFATISLLGARLKGACTL